jgi:DNA-binding FadR family transcriptional regulator
MHVAITSQGKSEAAPVSAAGHRLQRPTLLVPAVVSGLLGRIVTGELRPGTLLPKESELVTAYGVSRTVIREALRVLEEKGLIDVQQGRGTMVNDADRWNLLDPLIIETQVRSDRTPAVLGHLVEVRAAMEAELTRLAAERMSDADIAGLGEALRRLADAIDDHPAYLNLDQEFHDIILRAADNQYGRQFVRNVHGWNALHPLSVASTDEQIQSSHAEHTQVHALIAARRSQEAGECMRAHILHSWAVRKKALEEAARTERLNRPPG